MRAMNSSADHDRLQLVVSNASAGQLDAAEKLAAAVVDKVMAAEAWRLIGQAKANMQRFVAAVSSLDIALQHQPGSRVLRLERALLLERGGSAPEALAEFESLARDLEDSPGLLVHLARNLRFAGR